MAALAAARRDCARVSGHWRAGGVGVSIFFARLRRANFYHVPLEALSLFFLIFTLVRLYGHFCTRTRTRARTRTRTRARTRTRTRCALLRFYGQNEMWKQNQHWRAKAEALPVNDLMESVMTICAARFGSIHRGRTRSRPLRSAHSCTARPALLPSLNICRVCAACDRSRLLLLLGSQDRRASTARRCGLLLYTGRYHAERLGSSGASADRRAASIPSSCCGTAVAVWLPHAFLASQASISPSLFAKPNFCRFFLPSNP